MTKPFDIPKKLVAQSYKAVKANAGSAGVDEQSLNDFAQDLENNLYRLWNRLSSGSYFPPPVKAVEMPKKTGGKRILGVPTVSDRIAQMVVKLKFEPEVEKVFLPDSYGYRPGKSALDAVGVTRQRCWQYDWVIEFDIKGLFDHLPHDLLMKAVNKHTECKWVILYIQRWLKAPLQNASGEIMDRTQGTPQGGVISPVLSNLFLHYAFDMWIQRSHPQLAWCRYADDGVVHCHTLEQAQQVLEELRERLRTCGLELHPDKTRLVYCKDGARRQEHSHTAFDFLGYTFRPRKVKRARDGHLFIGFTPAISRHAQKQIRMKVRSLKIRNRTDWKIEAIAKKINPLLRGWINYYGRYCPSMLRGVFRHFNHTLRSWVMAKYKKFRNKKTRAHEWLIKIADRDPKLFAHWDTKVCGKLA